MTTDFTSIITTTASAQKASSEKFSVKANKNVVGSNGAFDSMLKSATKSYVSADRTSKEFAAKDYAKNTRNFNDKPAERNNTKTDVTNNQKSSGHNDVKNNDIKNTENSRVENKTQERTENKTIDAQEVQAKDTSPEKEQVSQIGEDIKSKETDKTTETTKNTTTGETENNHETSDIQNTTTGATENNSETSDAQNTTTTENTANILANEQIIANVQYQTGSVVSPEAEIPVDETIQTTTNSVENKGAKPESIPKEIIENIKQQLSLESKATNAQPVETIIENTKAEEPAIDTKGTELPKTKEEIKNSDIDVNIETTTKTKTDATVLPAKTAKENLAADISRLTVNLENSAQDDGAVITPTTNSDTTKTEQPVVKVTNEVAAQVKSQTNNLPENKDFTTKAKNNAVEQMTELQNTDTTVTESKMQTSSDNNNSLTQGNAQEQVAKLSVDTAAASADNTTGTESFLNKLNATMGTKSIKPQAAMLNQTSIMEQVNAKFNEMQQAGQNKVSIVLQPESLGKVSIEIMNSKDGIVAKMTTDSQQVKELFDKSVESLKSNLNSQGINVNNIKVECTSESSNNAMNFERDQFNQDNSSDSNNQQNQTNQNQTAQSVQSVYGENISTDDGAEEANRSVEIKNTDTIIKHNGKVDYKV